MTVDYFMEKSNELITRAHAAKDIARVSDNSVSSFKQASDFYRQAGDIVFYKILQISGLNNDDVIRTTSLGHYYRFEEFECLYSFNYKSNLLQNAAQNAQDAQKEIDTALSIIDSNFHSLAPDSKLFLAGMRKNWKSASLAVRLKLVEPIAKQALIDKNYIKAFDAFSQMLRMQKEVYEYDLEEGLDQVYVRIAQGNYTGMAANIGQTMVGVLTKKIEGGVFSFDLTSDLLGHLLNSLDLSFNAFKANPEWDTYRAGAEKIKENIKKLLLDNKNSWFKYLTNHPNDKYLTSIMREADNELYKRESAKLELEKDKIKRFLLVGTFWIVVFFCVLYGLLQLATSNISWYRFIAVMFGLPLVVTIIGAFILRTTDALKEENFLKLMTLALNINLRGLKTLSNKNGDKEVK